MSLPDPIFDVPHSVQQLQTPARMTFSNNGMPLFNRVLLTPYLTPYLTSAIQQTEACSFAHDLMYCLHKYAWKRG